MNNLAWNILNEEEKASLTLNTSYNKSTWEAGEILGKSHYKYLEINARARQFFKMFTEYFQKTGDLLIPENSDMNWDFRLFIECIILKRMKYRQTLKEIGKESKLCNKYAAIRHKAIEEYMEWLTTQDEIHLELYNIIKEFDRWNNFRVLPLNLQEPSAFQRRNKTRILKHLKNIYNLDAFIIDHLKSKNVKATNKGKRYYLPIVCKNNNNTDYEVLEINTNPDLLKHISKELGLYVFDDEEVADDVGFIMDKYLSEDTRTCVYGQQFWPKFRELTKKAINYNDVNNIHKKRSNIKDAFINTDKIKIKRIEYNEINKKIDDAQKRANDNLFWT